MPGPSLAGQLTPGLSGSKAVALPQAMGASCVGKRQRQRPVLWLSVQPGLVQLAIMHLRTINMIQSHENRERQKTEWLRASHPRPTILVKAPLRGCWGVLGSSIEEVHFPEIPEATGFNRETPWQL